MEPVESLLPVLRRAAGDLMRQRSIRDLEKTLAGIVHAAVDTVPGADAGGLSINENGRVSARNACVTAGLFGVQAAILLYGSQHATHLMRAVDSRDVIGQSKGILMERFGVDEDEAFQMLVSSSQETNMKLVDVANRLQRETAERRRAPRGVDAEAPH